jgi:hypothetical protein
VVAVLLKKTISAGSGSGQVPFSFNGAAPNNSNFSTTQSIVPAATTAAQVGRFNIFLKFPNSGAGSSFQDHQTETFSLIAAGSGAAGLTASAFNAASLPTAAGNAFFALASITNAGGNPASGIAFLAPSAIPEPASFALVLASSGMLIGLAVRRRRS